MKFLAAPALLAVLCVFTASCAAPNAFDEDIARAVAASHPVQLDSEQVSMNTGQLACGANNDLWEAPIQGGDRSISRLEPKGRALNFSDDVSSDEPAFPNPYTQVRGTFSLQMDRVFFIKDEDKDTKIVQARVGIKVPHSCFTSPLMIMGLRKGAYADDQPVTLEYQFDGYVWTVSKIVH